MEAGAIRLNLGCGDKLLPGYVNVDLPGNWSGKPPDVVADVTKRLPFDDNHADEIKAIHLIEHLNRWDAQDVLADWLRVLKPGGLLVLEMPCLDKIIRLYSHALIDGKTLDWRLGVMGLYGDPRHFDERMMHRWCYSKGEAAELLRDIGFESIQILEPETHQPKRDFRVTGRKPHGDFVQRAEK